MKPCFLVNEDFVVREKRAGVHGIVKTSFGATDIITKDEAVSCNGQLTLFRHFQEVGKIKRFFSLFLFFSTPKNSLKSSL